MMAKAVRTHPDVFDIVDGKLPQWPKGGGGKVIPGKKINPVPPAIQKLLLEGQVIGYAHTTKQYAPWQIVDKNDVDAEEAVLFPFSVKDLQQSNERNKKRKRIAHTDHTYSSL